MKKVNPGEYVKPSLFMQLNAGENRIRVLDGIYEYKKWGTKVNNRYISKIVFDPDEAVDPIFTRPDKDGKIPMAKQCWGFVVWSPKAKEFRVLEAGIRLGHQLADMIDKDTNFKEKDVIITKIPGKYSFETTFELKWAKDSEALPERTPAEVAEYRYCQRYFEEKR